MLEPELLPLSPRTKTGDEATAFFLLSSDHPQAEILLARTHTDKGVIFVVVVFFVPVLA